ncbi:MAG: class I SAM-dependent RNA methyltransferase [Planctomycetes bacterium]|nr:class I SAM-dependent RNA methyltransferase [Planctomycetota bacterium]
MSTSATTHDAFASCQPGLESLVAAELSALGAAPRPLAGGVAFAADATMIMRAAHWLGCASHVLVRLAEFPCRALGELERKAARLPWSDWLRRDVPLAMRATTKGSRVYHTDAVVERVGNAITAALGPMPRATAGGEAGDADHDPDDRAQLMVRFRNDVCAISLDATTTPLHRRGYRLAAAKAPLREDLAHALVLASGFEDGQALLDPFCGSGTIAIEAAALAAGLAPGRLRPPPLLHTALFDADAWQQVLQLGRAARSNAPIAAADRDAGAIEMARANAERAGVGDKIEFSCTAFSAHPWLQPNGAPGRGVVVTNPPFGRRVARDNSLLHLYQSLGHRIDELGAGWRATLLAHDVRLARRTGLELSVAFTTKHGGLSVTALGTGAGEAAAA